MNRSQSQAKLEGGLSQKLLSNAHRAIATLVLMALVPAAAVAQYPGGGPAPSYGSKGAVIGGVAAGAAVGVGLLYWKLHKQSKLEGCVAGDGDKLVVEKSNQTYNLSNKQNQSLKAGTQVELFGRKAKNTSGEPTFEVQKLGKELGQCTSGNMAEVKAQN